MDKRIEQLIRYFIIAKYFLTYIIVLFIINFFIILLFKEVLPMLVQVILNLGILFNLLFEKNG